MLLGDFGAKVVSEDISKPTIGNEVYIKKCDVLTSQYP